MEHNEILESITKLGNTPQPEELLRFFENIGAVYECKKTASGKRRTPLVGYPQKYESDDGIKIQYVGDTYFNFSIIEHYPSILLYLAGLFKERYASIIQKADVIVALELTEMTLSDMLALAAQKRLAYLEKKVIRTETPSEEEHSMLSFEKQSIKKGDKVILMRHVFNTPSRTHEAINLIEKGIGAEIILFGSILNHSEKHEFNFPDGKNQPIPIGSLIYKHIILWKQNNETVREDIENKHVIWKPEKQWGDLMEKYEAADTNEETFT